MKLKNLSNYDSPEHKDSDSIIILVEQVFEGENIKDDVGVKWMPTKDIQKEIRKLGYYVDLMDIEETMRDAGYSVKSGKIKL